jgi:uncharacterized protein
MATVTELWRYPVKSMQGERVGSSRIDERGLAFDRAYALVDAATGKLASAKRPRPWGALMQMCARVIDDGSGGSPPVVEVDFGGESTVIRGADDAPASKTIGEWVGREVRIVSVAPEAATFEEVWVPDMGAPESMYAPVTAEDEDGLPVLSVPGSLGAPNGALFDFSSLHILAAASIRSLSAALGGASVDVRRFRPNLLIETEDGAADYPDNQWSRSVLRVGGSLEVQGMMATMRCVMVTLPQGELAPAREVLQTLNRVNRLDVPSMGSYPCIGVYARVVRAGTVSEGDEVVVLDG